MIPLLYRGDSLPNTSMDHSDPIQKGKTFAEYYKTNGLMSKFSTGGTDDIFSLGLPYIVASHIGYIKDPDPKKLNTQTRVMNKSPLISFTSKSETAYYYQDRSQKAKLVEESIDEATHFVWSLNIDYSKVIQLGSGHFRFIFQASNTNVNKFLVENIKAITEMTKDPDSMDMNDFGNKLGELLVAQHTENDISDHFSELIDAVTYLNANACIIDDKELLNRALDRANESNEWLLFPKDPFGSSFSAKFPLNSYLDLDHWAKRVKCNQN